MMYVRCRRLKYGRPTDLPATGPRGECLTPVALRGEAGFRDEAVGSEDGRAP